MANKEANETTDTTTEDATKFKSETPKLYFMTILEDIYETDLKNQGRSSVADNTNINTKTARLIKMFRVGCYNHNFNFGHEDYN